MRHGFTSLCHKIFSMSVLLVSLDMSSGFNLGLSTLNDVNNPETKQLETVQPKLPESTTKGFAISQMVRNNIFSDSIKVHRNNAMNNVSSKLSGSDKSTEATQRHLYTDNMKTELNSNKSSQEEINLLKEILQSKHEKVLSATSILNLTHLHLKDKSYLHDVLQKETGQFPTDDDAIVLSREKRNEHCSNTVRQRSICPWHYEYCTNYTLLPETVQSISCSGSRSSIRNVLIQCHQLYMNTWFKLRNCIEGPETSCYVLKRVKSGCQATFPCIVPAQN